MVTAPEQAVGGTLTNFYSDERVCDFDEFWVLAVRKDGSSTW
jgi:hypothetical protein